jgi:hypothetical protein
MRSLREFMVYVEIVPKILNIRILTAGRINVKQNMKARMGLMFCGATINMVGK